VRRVDYRPPFPWFGGKSPVADLVWSALGDVANYVEPFCGSCAVLMLRPGGAGHIEIVNDADGLLANFWRALQKDSDAVAEAADNPVNEADLHARHLWLLGEKPRITERLMGDPEFFDAKAAGWWCWGQCCWIGSGWCSGNGPWTSEDGEFVLGNPGKGVNRQLPHLGPGKGVNRQLPHLGDPGQASTDNGVWRQRPVLDLADVRGVVTMAADGGTRAERLTWLKGYLGAFADRLRGVRVCCGDWNRVCGHSVTFRHGLTGVFLDPPYGTSRTDRLYAEDCPNVAQDAARLAIEQSVNPLMRIVLAGYEGEYEIPSDWRVEEWEAFGGYGLISDDEESTGRANKGRERLWCSPACLKQNRDTQRDLFSETVKP
jgi:hypothetical protein